MESHLNSSDTNAERQHLNGIKYIYPHPFGANVGYKDKQKVSASRKWSRLDHRSNDRLHCKQSDDSGNGPPHAGGQRRKLPAKAKAPSTKS
eukprot:15140084-Heterocapsa_arctica.AAC.1